MDEILKIPITQLLNSSLPPICFNSNLTLQEGCAALAQHKISSAPVYDEESGGFVGMFDFRDLVFHKVPREKHGFDSEIMVTDIVKRALQNNVDIPVKLVSNMSALNPLVSITSTEPLMAAVLKFQQTPHLQRLVILSTDQNGGSKRFLGILSLSTIAAFIATKLGRLATPTPSPGLWPLGDKSISEVGLVKGGVISITQHDTVLDALYSMYTNKVSSVAIVDRSSGFDQLLGSISMSDMKDILSARGGFRHLYENGFKFFAALRSAQGLANDGNDRVPSFVVHPTTSLIGALEKIAATHGHRVWIVDGLQDRLVGLVSVSDLVQFFN